MALPTKGRVIINTTAGELDIELWSKETPKACRNFITLAMEGYYDGNIFHRIVPGFLIQTGDRTGSGGGGESIYGEPFEDEIHPRLRFPHRGLVALANNGTKNSNDSQFFITLDRAEELHGKHTLFGRCIGDTIFNALKIGSMEINEDGKPLYPPKVNSVRILDNPFPDIVPRITAEEKRAQQRARERAQREREDVERRRGAKKNTKLLSFGEDENPEADGESTLYSKRSIIRPDLVDHVETAVPLPPSLQDDLSSTREARSKHETKSDKLDNSPRGSSKAGKADTLRNVTEDIAAIRASHAKQKVSEESAKASEVQRMEEDIRKLVRRRDGDGSDDERKSKHAKGGSLLEAELSRYRRKAAPPVVKGKKRDEGSTLDLLNSFSAKIRSSATVDNVGSKDDSEGNVQHSAGEGADEGDMEVDDDVGWIAHRLHFPKGNEEEVNKAERDYEVIDPRKRGQQAREEERERKRQEQAARSKRKGHR